MVGTDSVRRVSVSAIVRVRNEAAALDRCLALLRGQSAHAADLELIVVDHASADGSAAVARRYGARVLTIPRDGFSFGGALNRGAEVSTRPYLLALSAHAYLPDPGWLGRAVGALETRPELAAACGERFWPDASPLTGPVDYDAALAAAHPRWGYSNVAGLFRAERWRERPFREDLPGAEDREWGRHQARAGHPTRLDPALLVEHDHTHDPVRQIFGRARREEAAFTRFLTPAERRRPPLLMEWWSDTRFYANPWRARASHRRAARLLGERVGARFGDPGQVARPPGNAVRM